VRRRGVILVVSGPSGVGKGTAIRHLLKMRPDVRRSISYTTRPPRRDEVEGVDYHFVSTDEFERMRQAGEFLEWAVVHREQSYGTSRRQVDEAVEAGVDVVLEIDYQGAMAVRSARPEAVLVFLAPPTWAELLRRLRGRETEQADEIRKRTESAFREIENIARYDYLVVNDRSNVTARTIAAIIEAERHRLSRLAWEELRDRLLEEANAARA
jgi:guanylate kinase